MADPNPTFRRRQLGVRLRELRLGADMTVEEVAGRLLCSPSKISRMETGQRAASLRDVRDLCGIYEVGDPAEQERLMALAQDAKQRGWWQEYDDLGGIKKYIGLEDRAVRISVFRPSTVPALLQTRDYARASIRGILPRINESVLTERVESRLHRQQRLTAAEPPQVNVFIDEAVMHRCVGDAATMSAQADRIVEFAALRNVTVRIIPYSAGAHPAVDSTFNYLEFEDPSIPDIVYVEGLVGDIYIEREHHLARYREAIGSLGSAALDPAASLDLIKKIGGKFAEMAARNL